jgi:hypothetical protein
MAPLAEETARQAPRLRALVQRSQSLKLAEIEKREQANQCMESNNFMQAWELYDEIGDRAAAQQALEQSRRNSNRTDCLKLWTAPAHAQMDRCEKNAASEVEDSTGELLATSAFIPFKVSESRRPVSAGASSLSTSAQSWRPSSAGGSSQASLLSPSSVSLAKKLRQMCGLNQRKVDKVKDMYRQCKEDGPIWGPMSRAEFRKGIASFLVLSSVNDADVDSEFTRVDVDDDGFITEDEFVEWCLHM